MSPNDKIVLLSSAIFQNFRHFEIDTGQCPPKSGDSWWITTSKENSMINYLQIKKWGPTRDRLASYVRADTLWYKITFYLNYHHVKLL